MFYDVCFIVMPFASIYRPSIGVSLLKSGLKKLGISSKIHYFNVDFADTIGSECYDPITARATSLLGEWIFSNSAFKRSSINIETIKNYLTKNRDYFFDEDYDVETEFSNLVLELEKHVQNFIDKCVHKVLQDNPRIIGFTSIFAQHCSSI